MPNLTPKMIINIAHVENDKASVLPIVAIKNLFLTYTFVRKTGNYESPIGALKEHQIKSLGIPYYIIDIPTSDRITMIAQVKEKFAELSESRAAVLFRFVRAIADDVVFYEGLGLSPENVRPTMAQDEGLQTNEPFITLTLEDMHSMSSANIEQAPRYN
ncbi:hypothetical protein AB4254_11865 [Vibrio breoganii]